MFAFNVLSLDTRLGPRLGRVLFRWSVGARLMTLMALAAATGIGLMASGLHGMANTAKELQRLHDERMVPVRTLADISRLMLSNQYQLQLALARLPDHNAAHAVAAEVAQNARQITLLWDRYRSTQQPQQEDRHRGPSLL